MLNNKISIEDLNCKSTIAMKKRKLSSRLRVKTDLDEKEPEPLQQKLNTDAQITFRSSSQK